MHRILDFMQNLTEPKMQLPKERKLFSNADLSALIIPLFIESLLQMIVGIADTLMVSYAGEATVSGVSLDTMVYTIFIYMFTAIASGGAVVVSQYIGSGRLVTADLAAAQLYRIAIVFSLICTAIMLPLGAPLLRGLYGSVEGDVMEACQTYLWIVTLSFPANAMYNAGAAIYRSIGKTKTTMYVSMAMNLLNVAGNAIGIFVLRAGAAGVAWPTTLSWYFAAIVMTALCCRRDNSVVLRLKLLVRREYEMVRRILGIAVPNSVENGLFQISKVVLGALVATFGTSEIAANGIGQTIWSLAAVMGVALSPAFITVVGRCMGAGDEEAADYYLQKMTRLAIISASLWNLLILLLMPLLLPLYDITDTTRHLVLVIVIIHNIFSATVQPFSGPMAAGLRAAGDVKYTMYAAIFCTVICRVALSFLFCLGFHMGVVGIAWAMVLDWTIKAVLILRRYRSGVWKRFRVI